MQRLIRRMPSKKSIQVICPYQQEKKVLKYMRNDIIPLEKYLSILGKIQCKIFLTLNISQISTK